MTVPHVHMDVTAALAGDRCIHIPSTSGGLDAKAALDLSEDIRSAALIAAQLASERDHERSYRKTGDTVVHGDPAHLIGGEG